MTPVFSWLYPFAGRSAGVTPTRRAGLRPFICAWRVTGRLGYSLEAAKKPLLSLRGSNNETGVSWRKIKGEYVAGGISQRALAEKYGVPFGTLQKRSRKEKWTEKRRKAEEKAVEKVSQKTAEIVADNATLCEQIKTKLLKKLSDMVDSFPTGGAQEIKYKTKTCETVYRMKDLAAVYAALEDKTAHGQSADIEDLAPLAELLRDE